MKTLFAFCVFTSICLFSASGAGSGTAGSSGEPVFKEESSAVSLYNQGVDLMRGQKWAQAQAKFEQAVKADPKFAEAHNNLAFTLRKQGSANFQKSLEHYNKAIQLNSKLAEAYMYRGVLFTQMGRKTDAESDLLVLKKLNPHLAQELAEFMKTGKEDDELYGATKKLKS
jgi:tetratricopeptide (TPR) repeat protein